MTAVVTVLAHLRLSELAAQVISGAFDSTVIPASAPDWHDGHLG
ncbi:MULTISPECIES: hypothetical protein [unclassified Streptomyces]|nr:MULTISPECIES: hypothetical protein [unclassified Streptomyces]MEE1765018.1 hypothetical protein [Streptomyces sp. SP18BB07]MEE1831569.1 hypothetical protein [Streptomyces sp. SP17KL33]